MVEMIRVGQKSQACNSRARAWGVLEQGCLWKCLCFLLESLSLEGAVVGTLWAYVFAYNLEASLPWQLSTAFFLLIWLAYLADRAWDALSKQSASIRHSVFLLHTRKMICLCIAIIMAIAFLSTSEVLRVYVPTACLWLLGTVAYLRIAQCRNLGFAKPWLMSVFFATACMYVGVSTSVVIRPSTVVLWMAFIVLCRFNLAIIRREVWPGHWFWAASIPFVYALFLGDYSMIMLLGLSLGCMLSTQFGLHQDRWRRYCADMALIISAWIYLVL